MTIKLGNIKLIASLCLLLLLENAYSQKETKGSFSTEFKYTKNYGYILQVPDNKKDKKPMIVFLHGSGERGTDTELVKVHGPLKYVKTHELDAFILAPQCPPNEVWDAEVLYRLIQKMQKENNIDPQRIYLTGLSMGGLGTWDLSFAHPETFAAVVPICGFINLMDDEKICNIKDVPVRMFHGALDDAVDVNFAIAIYKKLKECGGNVQMTIFDDANHDSWSRVYDNPEIYDWMLKQTKK